MSLARDYKSGVGKVNGGPGGWKCACCNSYGCHPRNMKALAHRRVRRVARVELQAALMVDVVGAEQVEDQVYEMDQYHRELRDQNEQATWQEMDDYEEATGMKFVCEGHYYQQMAFLDWAEKWDAA